MHRIAIRTLVISLCLIALPALAQQNRVVRVGVAIMQSHTNPTITGDVGRNRLVTALDEEKPDKNP